MTPEKMAKLHSNSEANHRIWHAREFAQILPLKGVFAECHQHGFALARVIDSEAELLLLVTHKMKQNTGLATNCLLKIEQKLVENGARKLSLLKFVVGRKSGNYALCRFAEYLLLSRMIPNIMFVSFNENKIR